MSATPFEIVWGIVKLGLAIVGGFGAIVALVAWTLWMWPLSDPMARRTRW